MSNRLPLHEIFQVLNYIFRHNSIIKLDHLRDNYATIASIASCGAAWIYIATQQSHFHNLEKRIDYFEQKTKELRQSRSSTKQLKRETEQMINSAAELNTSKSSIWIPTTLACASIFIGSYFFARSRTQAKLLRQWKHGQDKHVKLEMSSKVREEMKNYTSTPPTKTVNFESGKFKSFEHFSVH